MSCYNINNGTLCMANINFDCPKCHKAYSDLDEKYLNRCNRNRNGCTLVKCTCGQSFYVTYNYMGDIVTFLPLKQKKTRIKQNLCQ